MLNCTAVYTTNTLEPIIPFDIITAVVHNDVFFKIVVQ